jgi:hypothetical protein
MHRGAGQRPTRGQRPLADIGANIDQRDGRERAQPMQQRGLAIQCYVVLFVFPRQNGMVEEVGQCPRPRIVAIVEHP